MRETKCTEGELLEAIISATTERNEEGLTTLEISRLTGLTIERVRERLSNLKQQGHIEVVKVVRTTLNDVQQHFSGYRVKPIDNMQSK